MTDIRIPAEGDRQAIIDMMRIAFNVPSAWQRHVAPLVDLNQFLAAYDGTRLVAMSQAWDLRQWFGGRALPMAGIAAVAALPERRGEGLAPDVLRALLRKCREEGSLLSTLYPSRGAVYRRLGYEYAGVLLQHKISIDLLPSGVSASVEEYTEGDLPAVQACYRETARAHNGLVDSDLPNWWGLRVFRRWNPDTVSRSVVVRGSDGVEGYASFIVEPIADSWGFRLACTHMIGATERGLKGLLDNFRAYRGLGQWLVWYGPPNDPVSLLVGGGAESVQPARLLRTMTRLLDVPGAIQARGYGHTSGEAVIRVKDELFPDNEGPFRIVARGGRVEVERVKSDPEATLPIGPLSALFTGFVSPVDLGRAGLIEGEGRALGFLGDLFAGPTPWMTDFF
jgi:predicted acetyltransferase